MRCRCQNLGRQNRSRCRTLPRTRRPDPLRSCGRKAAARHRSQVIALGTAIAGGPPRRCVCECLPHTAPPLSTNGHNVAIVTRRECSANLLATWSGSVSGVTVDGHYSSSATPFPPQTPPPAFWFCSLASQVVRSHLTSRRCACQSCPRRGSLTVLDGAAKESTRSPGSRGWSVAACSGSQTPSRPSASRP